MFVPTCVCKQYYVSGIKSRKGFELSFEILIVHPFQIFLWFERNTTCVSRLM